MQPNQQIPPQPSPNSGQPYQVPGYLQLDQTPQPAPTKNRRPLIIILVLVLLLAVGGVGVWLWSSFQLTPEQRFASVLGASMKTPYVSRKITIDASDARIKLAATADSDLSDPAHPKGHLTYTYSQQPTPTNNTTLELAGEEIVLGNDIYVKLTKAPAKLVADSDLNQWHPLSASDAAQLGKFDTLNLRSFINSSLYLIPMGNYQDSQRSGALSYAQSHGVYALKDISQKSADGQNLTVYSVTTTAKAQDAYAISLASLLKSGSTDSAQSQPLSSLFSVWAAGNDKPLKITTQGTGSSTATGEIDFSYPSSLSVTAPQ